MKKAFTLAEVLITLGIIGIVAAMTLPALIQKNNEKQTVVKLKKVYSMLQQAHLNIINEYGPFDSLIASNTSTGEVDENGNTILDYTSTEYLKSLFAEQLKVIKSCEAGVNCLGKLVYKLDGNITNGGGVYKDPTLILADGTRLFFGWAYSGCSDKQRCLEVGVALPNSTKDRYVLGKDIFYYVIYKDKIVPEGNTNGKLSDTSCNTSSSIGTPGRSCTAWVIMNENLDYLHCNDLEWGKKTKCK